ncbi:hypothetical protein D3C87_1511760 [compost metagenome]
MTPFRICCSNNISPLSILPHTGKLHPKPRESGGFGPTRTANESGRRTAPTLAHTPAGRRMQGVGVSLFPLSTTLAAVFFVRAVRLLVISSCGRSLNQRFRSSPHQHPDIFQKNHFICRNILYTLMRCLTNVKKTVAGRKHRPTAAQHGSNGHMAVRHGLCRGVQFLSGQRCPAREKLPNCRRRPDAL